MSDFLACFIIFRHLKNETQSSKNDAEYNQHKVFIGTELSKDFTTFTEGGNTQLRLISFIIDPLVLNKQWKIFICLSMTKT